MEVEVVDAVRPIGAIERDRVLVSLASADISQRQAGRLAPNRGNVAGELLPRLDKVYVLPKLELGERDDR